ncbi:DNA alkylation repair protein [Aliifodinibius salipaludis]|uniref:DNA alkylation repair protein n=1 Tax=Fodinibius salipaludis TaxID=2032627 RepID=UPI0020D17251|nr:DNA alkylation repair protein [Aliifodinibius salipaludis]
MRVPKVRKVAEKFNPFSLEETKLLLHSDYHEERLCALIILVHKSQKAEKNELKKIFDLYLKNTNYINNWDLVDTSAEHIVGAYLSDKDRSILYELAKSDNLWERRIAILSTFHFIKNDDFEDTLAIAELLLEDEHDLIHKATGWMLHETGKQDEQVLKNFLDKHIGIMPRTMLRYAIEKLPESDRQMYLSM